MYKDWRKQTYETVVRSWVIRFQTINVYEITMVEHSNGLTFVWLNIIQ